MSQHTMSANARRPVAPAGGAAIRLHVPAARRRPSPSAARPPRGHGALRGIEPDRPCASHPHATQGWQINVTAGSVARLPPPLVITDAKADRNVARFASTVPAPLRQPETVAG